MVLYSPKKLLHSLAATPAMAAVRPSPPSSEVKSPAGTAGAAAGAPYTTPNASPSKQLRPHNSNVGSGSGGLRTTPVKKGLLESTAGATAGNGSGSGGPGSGRKQKSSAPQVGALHQLAQRASPTAHTARLLLLFHSVYASSSQCKHTAKTQPHRIGLHAADYSSVMCAVAIDKENNVDTTTSNGGGVTAS